MSKKQLYCRHFCFAIGLILSILIAIYFLIPTPQETTITQMSDALKKRVVTISAVKNNEKTGVLILRLRDALGQFLAGDFSTALSSDGTQAIAYKDNSAYFILDGNKVITSSITASYGTITKASFSPDSKYAALETLSSTGSRSYCLFKISSENMKSAPCNNLTVIIGDPVSIWLPEEPHTFVIISGSNMTTWDLDDSEWTTLSADKNPLVFEYAKKALIQKAPTWSGRCLLSRCIIRDESGTVMFKVTSDIRDALSIEHIAQKTYAIYNEKLIWLVDISSNSVVSVNITQLPATLTADSRVVSHE